MQAPPTGARQTPLAPQTSVARHGAAGPHGARRSPSHAPETHLPCEQSASTVQAVPESALQRPVAVQSQVYPRQHAWVVPEHGASWP